VSKSTDSAGRWEAGLIAEESAWIAACQKMRAAAARSHPDNMASQNELFENLRQKSLAHHWRAPN
jgi:hypothetical protein